MTTDIQGIMKREVPFEEWHGQKAWAEQCPQCVNVSAEWVGEMPQEYWGEGLGNHATIREIIALQGSCGHQWHVLVGMDERRAIFYFI